MEAAGGREGEPAAEQQPVVEGTRPEFTLLWSQFWIGDNPAEPGNLMFGPVPA
jgi:hypothetical protein